MAACYKVIMHTARAGVGPEGTAGTYFKASSFNKDRIKPYGPPLAKSCSKFNVTSVNSVLRPLRERFVKE